MKFTNEYIRRQDRLLDEQHSLEILQEGEFGVLSMQTEDGKGAYGIPLNYVWNGEQSIYVHCAPKGRKLNCINICNHVSFCIVGRTKVIPEKFTTAYESVVLECAAHIGLDDNERKNALSYFIGKYCPDLKEIGMMNAEKSFHRTEIIRLDILQISGKSKRCF